MQRVLNNAFASRSIYKRYEAVVDGLLTLPVTGADDDWQTIDLPIALDWPNRPRRIIDTSLGKPSQTRWQVMQVNPATHSSRLRLEPLTGRSHQLRVHLRAIGHPILGDALYAPPAVAAQAARLLLHATELALRHPVSLQPLRFVSPAPF